MGRYEVPTPPLSIHRNRPQPSWRGYRDVPQPPLRGYLDMDLPPFWGYHNRPEPLLISPEPPRLDPTPYYPLRGRRQVIGYYPDPTGDLGMQKWCSSAPPYRESHPIVDTHPYRGLIEENYEGYKRDQAEYIYVRPRLTGCHRRTRSPRRLIL